MIPLNRSAAADAGDGSSCHLHLLLYLSRPPSLLSFPAQQLAAVSIQADCPASGAQPAACEGEPLADAEERRRLQARYCRVLHF